MNVSFTINNYTLGAKLKSAPKHKMVSKMRIDKNHTEVVFNDCTKQEVAFMEKLFAKKAREK